MKRYIALLMLLILGTQSLLAQDTLTISPEEAVDMPRVFSLIHSVEVVEQSGQPALLIFGTMPDGCERDTFITKERQGDVLFVDVYHAHVAPSVVACPDELIPLALTIPAEELLALDDSITLPTLLVVNDQYYAINIAAIEAMPDAGLPPITLSPLTRTDLAIKQVTTKPHNEGGVDVKIKGWLPEGCSDPVHSRVIPRPDTNEYIVDIFRAIDDPMMCPMTSIAVAFDLTVTTPADADSEAVFFIKQEPYTYTPQAASTPGTGDDSMHVLHTIESVDALLMKSKPVQIMLKVKGYQPDGCEMPVQIEQSREGNTVKVEIFRELAPDTACPMVIKQYDETIKLDGNFEPGSYSIDVNGTVITVQI
jgi:hypothetical protein